MSRWQPDARERLEQAALDLFAENGFAETTVPQIAERAGLTNRTFFRYFHDKREVLFSVDDGFPAGIAQIMRTAPETDDVWTLLSYGARTAAETFFPGRRDYFGHRRAIIAADPSLRERELGKQADLTAAIRDGLLTAGIGERESTLAAHVCAVVMHDAIGQWVDDDLDRPLTHFVTQNLETVRHIVGSTA